MLAKVLLNMSVKAKICGIRTLDALKACTDNGADFIGFVFYPSSPRYIAPEAAYDLTRQTPAGTRNVGLFVDPSDAELEHATSNAMLDMIQLHGDESRQRVAEIKAKTLMPVIKAIGMGEAEDIETARRYQDVTDWLLLDHKPVGSDKGGTGQSFDWSLLKSVTFTKPWMLSGGLTAENIAQALYHAAPQALDTSSGVESTRGIKDTAKIKAFLDTAKAV